MYFNDKNPFCKIEKNAFLIWDYKRKQTSIMYTS